jgi:hypothetical protein
MITYKISVPLESYTCMVQVAILYRHSVLYGLYRRTAGKEGQCYWCVEQSRTAVHIQKFTTLVYLVTKSHTQAHTAKHNPGHSEHGCIPTTFHIILLFG